MVRRKIAARKISKKKAKNKQKISSRIFTVEGVVDRFLLQIVCVIVIFGLLMIASAGVIYADVNFGDENFFFKRQLFGTALGFISMFIFSRIDYHFFRKWSFLIFVGSLVVLSLTLISGLAIESYGASRWLSLGPFSFQPSEMVKLTLILYVSAWCSAKGRKGVSDFNEGFLPFMVILATACALIIAQPDVGTTGMIAMIAISIFFLAGAQIQHIVSIFGLGLISLVILVATAKYRLARFTSFLNPEEHLDGAGYQIYQALIAIGSGGFSGLGLGRGQQKALYLPEPVGDSIFAIIAEELGFIGVVCVLIAFLLFASRGMKISRNAPDLFGRLIAGGIVTWVMGQAIMNIAGISALIPLTGITLPFISYGGTSIVFVLTAIGILLNISRQSTILERN